MGDIAEMMLEGELCCVCGTFLERSLGEFPQMCPSCDDRHQWDRAADGIKKGLTQAAKMEREDK